MKKQFEFLEHLKTEKLLRNGSGPVLIRSVEFYNRCTDVAQMYEGTSNDSQYMKTRHIPKSMMSAPFLQHPALTAGQRRYVCSIAATYSTEHMRRLMKQRYADMLHTCVQSGRTLVSKRRHGGLTKDAKKDAETRAKPQGLRKSSTVDSDVILPKIVIR